MNKIDPDLFSVTAAQSTSFADIPTSIFLSEIRYLESSSEFFAGRKIGCFECFFMGLSISATTSSPKYGRCCILKIK